MPPSSKSSPAWPSSRSSPAAAEQRVVAGAAFQMVVAAGSVEIVVAGPADDVLVAVAADEDVVAVGQHDLAVAAVAADIAPDRADSSSAATLGGRRSGPAAEFPAAPCRPPCHWTSRGPAVGGAARRRLAVPARRGSGPIRGEVGACKPRQARAAGSMQRQTSGSTGARHRASGRSGRSARQPRTCHRRLWPRSAARACSAVIDAGRQRPGGSSAPATGRERSPPGASPSPGRSRRRRRRRERSGTPSASAASWLERRGGPCRTPPISAACRLLPRARRATD